MTQQTFALIICFATLSREVIYHLIGHLKNDLWCKNGWQLADEAAFNSKNTDIIYEPLEGNLRYESALFPVGIEL